MGARNIIRLWTAGLKAEPQLDLASGETLVFKPAVDDQGSIEIGDGTTDMDLKIFLGATGDIATFDNSEGHLVFDNAEINMGDNDEIEFGDGPDIQMQWNATYMQSGPVTGMWANCPSTLNQDPNVSSVFYDDFFSFYDGDTTGPWTLDQTNGTAVLGNASDSNTPGNGFVEMETTNVDNDFANLRLGEASTGAGWNFSTSGLRTWFECGFMVSSVTDCTYYVGMCEESVTEAGADDTGDENIQDGIYFRTLTGEPTEVDFAVNQNGTETEVQANGATLATNTAIRVGFFTDGTTITPYFNGTAGTTSLHSATNFPSDQSLTPFFFLKTGTTAIAILRVDYVKVVQMRA